MKKIVRLGTASYREGGRRFSIYCKIEREGDRLCQDDGSHTPFTYRTRAEAERKAGAP